MSTSLIRSRSRHLLRSFPFPENLTFTRPMGGGPRTFPGGLNKWQYKRMHEKLARDKEYRLLRHEKQLYLARLRSEIRAQRLNESDSSERRSNSDSAASFSPMSSKEHIKALADRFTKPGAEDLWNEDDGPIKNPPREVVEGSRSPLPSLGSFTQKRGYSVVRRWKRNSSSEEEPESELESESETGDGRVKMFSSAALREHDVKREKRAHRPFGETRGFVSEIQEIRDELRYKREVMRREECPIDLTGDSLLTKRRFDEFDISPLTVTALADAGYVQATVVQEAALPVSLEGKDVLVKARTGTGKSMAFLIPAIEAVIKTETSNTTNLRISPMTVLVLCPTRELAVQLSAEARVLLKYHEGIGVQSLIGGTRFKLDQKRLESGPCQILVATPGRLLDHIENKTGFSVRLMGLKLLVLDEADHLLNLGFRKDIEKIVDCLPRQRQSILFSATIPKEVRRVSQLVLKRDHEFVDTVGLSVETPTKVLQSCLVLPHELHFHMVYHLLLEHITQEPDYKAIIFCTTAMVTEFMFVMLRDLRLNVREIHSRKPQLYRTRISHEFRDSNQIILVTSDVTSRGLNYPDVTLVIQVGIPSDREQYIHRLGRTGREGKNGKGILLLAPWEEQFLDELKDLPIQRSHVPELDSDIKYKIGESIGKVDISIKEAAYHAWLGYYNSIGEIGRDKTSLADLASRFSRSIGLETPPALFRKTALKMGLKGIPGIRIRK